MCKRTVLMMFRLEAPVSHVRSQFLPSSVQWSRLAGHPVLLFVTSSFRLLEQSDISKVLPPYSIQEPTARASFLLDINTNIIMMFCASSAGCKNIGMAWDNSLIWVGLDCRHSFCATIESFSGFFPNYVLILAPIVNTHCRCTLSCW